MSGIIDPRTIRERTWKIMKSMIEKKERKKEMLMESQKY